MNPPRTARHPLEIPLLAGLIVVLALVARLGGGLGGRAAPAERATPEDAPAPGAVPDRDSDPAPAQDPPRGVERTILTLRGTETAEDALVLVSARPDWSERLFDGGPSSVMAQVVVDRGGVVSLVRWEEQDGRLRWTVALPFPGGSAGMRVMVLRSTRDWVPGTDDALDDGVRRRAEEMLRGAAALSHGAPDLRTNLELTPADPRVRAWSEGVVAREASAAVDLREPGGRVPGPAAPEGRR